MRHWQNISSLYPIMSAPVDYFLKISTLSWQDHKLVSYRCNQERLTDNRNMLQCVGYQQQLWLTTASCGLQPPAVAYNHQLWLITASCGS